MKDYSAWRDYWTGQTIQGPAWVTIPAPLHRIPLLLRDAADLKLPDPSELDLPSDGAGS